MPFRALVDAGFWQNDIVTEDSKNFFAMFWYVTMVLSRNADLCANYNGYSLFWFFVEYLKINTSNNDVGLMVWKILPYMAWHFLAVLQTTPFAGKFRYVWNHLEDVYSWLLRHY